MAAPATGPLPPIPRASFAGALPRAAALLLASAVLVALTTLVGYSPETRSPSVGVPPSEILYSFRLPRAALAAVAGAALALGGVVFQSIFRNPLATPYTLGIDAGAALGAAIGFLTLSSTTLAAFTLWGVTFEYSRLTLLALAGAIGAIALVYLMSRLRGGHDLTRLLLGGVCISYLAAAGIMLATYLANRAITNEILYWIMGSLARHRPAAVLEITAILIPVAALMLTLHRALDLLAMGDVMAAARGVAVGRVIWGCLLSVGLLTAAVVAHCGPIGFVGLMIPHLCRAWVGPRAAPLLLASIAAGGAFLAVCDAAARSLSAYEVPVGVITNILGAGFFFWLLATADRRS